MKERGHTKTHTFRLSKSINAPLHFVYDWCTDYRESDPKIIGSKAKRKILLKTERRVIYISSYESRNKSMSGVNVVTLFPPRGWHLDFLGDEDDESGDYELVKLGPRRTRLAMTFTERYKMARPPTKEQDMMHTHEIWNRYVSALEAEYNRLMRR